MNATAATRITFITRLSSPTLHVPLSLTLPIMVEYQKVTAWNPSSLRTSASEAHITHVVYTVNSFGNKQPRQGKGRKLIGKRHVTYLMWVKTMTPRREPIADIVVIYLEAIAGFWVGCGCRDIHTRGLSVLSKIVTNVPVDAHSCYQSRWRVLPRWVCFHFG